MDSTKDSDPVAVARRVTIESIDANGGASPVEADLRYDPRDPYAVSLQFVGSAQIRWIFARELLTEGIYEPAGDGDVHVFPSLEPDGRMVVLIELCSPEGQALLKVGLRELAEFAELMLRSVPEGSEADLAVFPDTVQELFGYDAP